MSLVVRKTDYNKWMQNDVIKGKQPSADAITNCMRTFKNTLSVWFITDSTELEEAVLAIASQFDHLDTADFLILEMSLLEEKKLNIEYNQGQTPYVTFISNHRDIVNLDYITLGFMAEVIVRSIKRHHHERFTRGQLKKILQQGLKDGKIQIEALNENVRKKIPAIPEVV